MSKPLLSVRNLTTSFTIAQRRVVVVRDVGFELKQSRTLAVVGESGCGKSVTALSILRLIQTPPGRIESGEVWLDDTDLMKLDERKIRSVRGNRVSMIFQEPMTSLNPVFSIGSQIAEGYLLHRRVSRKQARQRVIELMTQVGIAAPEQRIDSFPHQLSGGMRQRAMIAMALICSPELLIADEPTTALDVTIQAQILDLLAKLQKELQMSVLLITHDLGVVAQHADDVLVMYAGQVVENAPVEQLFATPQHPYTAGLLASIPAHAMTASTHGAPRRLPTIEGLVPDALATLSGCFFAERCPRLRDLGATGSICHREAPELRELAAEHRVRCHFPLEVKVAN